jgi:phage gpG-like protein
MAAKTVSARGVKQTAEHIGQVGDRGSDISKAAAKVRTIYRQAQEAHFSSAGHGKWPPLDPHTVAQKGSWRILRRTDALYRSLTAARASYQVDERSRSVLTFGTTVPYAGYHDQGRGVPQRPLMTFTAAETKAMTDALGQFVTEGK